MFENILKKNTSEKCYGVAMKMSYAVVRENLERSATVGWLQRSRKIGLHRNC